MIRLPPEETAARRRARDAAKKRRRRAKRTAERRAAKAEQMVAQIVKPISKTSPLYRRRFPPLPEMTKGELRAMLAMAVANTGTRMATNA